ncbi:hypothetical protein HK102_014192, partial [Quaeritorhiza haematococci]
MTQIASSSSSLQHIIRSYPLFARFKAMRLRRRAIPSRLEILARRSPQDDDDKDKGRGRGNGNGKKEEDPPSPAASTAPTTQPPPATSPPPSSTSGGGSTDGAGAVNGGGGSTVPSGQASGGQSSGGATTDGAAGGTVGTGATSGAGQQGGSAAGAASGSTSTPSQSSSGSTGSTGSTGGSSSDVSSLPGNRPFPELRQSASGGQIMPSGVQSLPTNVAGIPGRANGGASGDGTGGDGGLFPSDGNPSPGSNTKSNFLVPLLSVAGVVICLVLGISMYVAHIRRKNKDGNEKGGLSSHSSSRENSLMRQMIFGAKSQSDGNVFKQASISDKTSSIFSGDTENPTSGNGAVAAGANSNFGTLDSVGGVAGSTVNNNGSGIVPIIAIDPGSLPPANTPIPSSPQSRAHDMYSSIQNSPVMPIAFSYDPPGKFSTLNSSAAGTMLSTSSTRSADTTNTTNKTTPPSKAMEKHPSNEALAMDARKAKTQTMMSVQSSASGGSIWKLMPKMPSDLSLNRHGSANVNNNDTVSSHSSNNSNNSSQPSVDALFIPKDRATTTGGPTSAPSTVRQTASPTEFAKPEPGQPKRSNTNMRVAAQVAQKYAADAGQARTQLEELPKVTTGVAVNVNKELPKISTATSLHSPTFGNTRIVEVSPISPEMRNQGLNVEVGSIDVGTFGRKSLDEDHLVRFASSPNSKTKPTWAGQARPPARRKSTNSRKSTTSTDSFIRSRKSTSSLYSEYNAGATATGSGQNS